VLANIVRWYNRCKRRHRWQQCRRRHKIIFLWTPVGPTTTGVYERVYDTPLKHDMDRMTRATITHTVAWRTAACNGWGNHVAVSLATDSERRVDARHAKQAPAWKRSTVGWVGKSVKNGSFIQRVRRGALNCARRDRTQRAWVKYVDRQSVAISSLVAAASTWKPSIPAVRPFVVILVDRVVKCVPACRALRSSRALVSIDIMQSFLLPLFVTESVFSAMKLSITANLGAKFFQRDIGNGTKNCFVRPICLFLLMYVECFLYV